MVHSGWGTRLRPAVIFLAVLRLRATEWKRCTTRKVAQLLPPSKSEKGWNHEKKAINRYLSFFFFPFYISVLIHDNSQWCDERFYWYFHCILVILHHSGATSFLPFDAQCSTIGPWRRLKGGRTLASVSQRCYKHSSQWIGHAAVYQLIRPLLWKIYLDKAK